MKRHFDQHHSTFNEKFPKGTALRSNKVNSLQATYIRSTQVIKKSTTEQEKATEASLKISWILSKHMLPFTHSEIVKDCLIEASDTMFEDKKIGESFRKILLSNNTNTCRQEINASKVFKNLISDLKSAPCFSIAVDESADIYDTVQMVVYVRFLSGGNFREEMLTLLPMHDNA